MENLLTLFEDIQRSKRSHKTHAKKINSMVENSNKTSGKNKQPNNPVLTTLLNGILDQTLLFSKSNPNIARILDFFSTLAASAGETLQSKLLDHLYQRLKCTNKTVRQRACQILEGFMGVLSQEQLELDQDTIEQFIENVLQRLQDRIPTIRIAAVEALKHLQDVTNEECEIIEQFLFMIENDDTPSVRNAVTKNIALCDQTKPAIVQRIRDIESDIRISALNRFIEGAGTGTDIRQFSKELRLEIVTAGLNDRDVKVREATEKLLMRWLSLLQNDVSKLFSYLAPAENEDIVNLVAASLADKVFTKSKLGDHHDLTVLEQLAPNWNATLSSIPATDLLWVYVKCKYCSIFQSKFDAEKFSERVLPEAGRFCQLLCTPYDEKNHLHFKYLLLLVPFVSKTTDPTGSKKLLSKLVEMILDPSGDCDLIEQLLLAFWTISIKDTNKSSEDSTVKKLMDFVRELIQDEGNSNSAFSLKKYRAALIVKWIFQNNHYRKHLMESGVQFILSSLPQPHVELRAVAFTSLSVLCIVDPEIRKNYQVIIKNIALAEIEDISVRGQAIQGLIDLCLVAGEDPESFSPQDRMEIDSLITKLMNSEHPELKAIAMEGSVKLLFSGFSTDPHMVSKLLKFFFIGDEHPADEDYEETVSTGRRMHQILSVFLQTFLANEQSCLEVVRLSISLFISEFTTSIRDEQIEATNLAQVFNNLFGICERVLTTADDLASKSKQQEDKNLLMKMKTSFSYLKETAAACICRELLKLGSDKVDKKICKEFIKVLGSLSVQWVTKSEVDVVKRVLISIKESVGMDKASLKIIDLMLEDVASGEFEENTDARASFYDCAPGLKDLVRIGQHDWDEPSQLDVSHLRRSPRKRSNQRKPRITMDSDDEEEDDAISEVDEEDDDEEEEEEEENEDVVTELPPSSSRLKHRTSR